MIYTQKKILAKHLNISRVTLDKRINDGDVKELFNQRGDRVGYCEVKEGIKYLIN